MIIYTGISVSAVLFISLNQNSACFELFVWILAEFYRFTAVGLWP